MHVSVIMPMRNAMPFVHEAIASVLACTITQLELLVVDDGSSDRSRETAMAFQDARVRIVNGPRLGIAACLNAGLGIAQGEVIMRCDADDRYPAGRIAGQLDWLAAHPRHVAVCGSFTTLDKHGQVVAHLSKHGAEDQLDISSELREGVMRTTFCAYAVKRAAVEALGGFRPYFETAEDIDFAFRLGELGAVGFVAKSAYEYRLHDDSITHTQTNARRTFFEETARSFSRERMLAGVDSLSNSTAPKPPDIASGRASLASNQIRGMHTGQAWSDLEAGDRRAAFKGSIRAIQAAPYNLKSWRTFAHIALRCCLPRRGTHRSGPQ